MNKKPPVLELNTYVFTPKCDNAIDITGYMRKQRDADVVWCEQAKAEVAREIIEWGEQPCIEHSKVPWPEELGGGTENRQKVKHRRCQHCWQSLKDKYLKGGK